MSDSKVVTNMIAYMQFVTHACDFFTICLIGTLVFNLGKQIYNDRKDPFESRKKRLYFTSIVYIMILPIFAFLNSLSSLFPLAFDQSLFTKWNGIYFFYLDLMQTFYLQIACIAFFIQWREQMNIYIECTYIRPVEQMIRENSEEGHRSVRFSAHQNEGIINEDEGFLDSEEAQENEIEMKFHESLTQRHTSMANKKTMANFILKVSKRLARRTNDSEIPLILKDANKAFYSALLMRTKLVPLCCFGTCRNNKRFIIDFRNEKDTVKARKFEIAWRISTCAIFIYTFCLTCIDFTINQIQNAEAQDLTQDNLNFEDKTMDVVEVIFALIVIYMIRTYKNFQNKVIRRDDPVCNATMFNILIFMIYIQRYMIKTFMVLVLGSGSKSFTDEFFVRFKCLIFSLELLFVQISIRHNFSLEHIIP